MFYLYLLLKHQFRSEIIQVSQQTGFLNFAGHQDRKDALLYRTMRCQKPAMFGRPYDAHRLDSSPKLRLYRKDPVLAGMYYYYYFSEKR